MRLQSLLAVLVSPLLLQPPPPPIDCCSFRLLFSNHLLYLCCCQNHRCLNSHHRLRCCRSWLLLQPLLPPSFWFLIAMWSLSPLAVLAPLPKPSCFFLSLFALAVAVTTHCADPLSSKPSLLIILCHHRLIVVSFTENFLFIVRLLSALAALARLTTLQPSPPPVDCSFLPLPAQWLSTNISGMVPL